jgi:hypothetical protein
MGKRDYRWKESKKSKKDDKKVSSAKVLPTPVIVEVIKKGKKEQSAEEE